MLCVLDCSQSCHIIAVKCGKNVADRRTNRRAGRPSGSRLACLTMVFKLAMSAQKSWRALNGATSLLADIIEGVKFEDGIKKKAA
jgi:putative transposase